MMYKNISTCIVCQKNFQSTSKSKYCSDNCKYTKKCELCSKEFKASSAYTKYCSNKCRNKRCINVCIVCGKQFRSGAENSKFCNNECRNKFGYKCVCAKCQNEFFSKIPNTKYCSYSCYDNAYSNICIVCDKEFNSRYPNTEYCSDSCRRNLYINTCISCSKEFRSMSNNAKFCSSKCMKTCTIEVICEYCKKAFKKSSISTVRVCSTKCRSLLEKDNYRKRKNSKMLTKSNYEDIVTYNVKEIIQKGIDGRNNFGISRNYYIDGFTSLRKTEVQERDNYTCRVCGKANSLEVHHIVKAIHGGDSKLDNLITLCISCHRAIDTLDIEYALKKCINNAEKYLGIIYVKDEFTIKERIELSILELNSIYRKISRLAEKLNDEIEIQESLIQLNDTIDKMQDSIE